MSKKLNLPIAIILGCTAVIAALFCIVLGSMHVLPTRYFIAVCLLMAVIVLVLFLLLRGYRNGFRCILGVILTITFCGALCYGGFLLRSTQNTLGKISTTTTVTVTEVSVYVRADDPAASIEDISDHIIGIMETQNRDISDKALSDLSAQLSRILKVSLFASPASLVKGLLEGQSDVILINSGLFDLVASNEEYAHIRTDLRLLTSLTVETETEIEAPANDASGDKSSRKNNKKKNNDPGNDDPTLPDEDEENFLWDEDVVTIYLTGIDTYGSIGNVSRSDVNILAAVNLQTHQVLLLSTPRDYYIPLANSYGNCDKLTHAGYYGVENSMATLEMLYGVHIDYYFRVNFSGFTEIVDALGGVTVDNDQYFIALNEYEFPEGEIELNGEEALAYVRERHYFSEGDLARGRHQMMVIKAAIKKVLSPEILGNFTGLLSAVEGNFETSIPEDLIFGLVQEQLDQGGDWNIVQYSVDGYPDWQTCWSYGDGLSVVTPYYDTVDTAIELIQVIMDGGTPVIP